MSPIPATINLRVYRSWSDEDAMVTVYGADWCEDTQRSLRHLRRLGVMHSYENVDASAEALGHAKSLNNGKRRTPTIDVEGIVLVEPANRELTRVLLDRRQVTSEQVERLRVRNVGDLERGLRVVFGLGLFTAATRLKSGWRWPLMASGVYDAVTGAIGACPIYQMLGLTSTGGPGDRPREAERSCWVGGHMSHRAFNVRISRRQRKRDERA